MESIYQRLRNLMEEEASVFDGVRHIIPNMTQQQIANRLGSSRDMVSRIFRELKKGGYIQVTRRGTELMKPLPTKW